MEADDNETKLAEVDFSNGYPPLIFLNGVVAYAATYSYFGSTPYGTLYYDSSLSTSSKFRQNFSYSSCSWYKSDKELRVYLDYGTNAISYGTIKFTNITGPGTYKTNAAFKYSTSSGTTGAQMSYQLTITDSGWAVMNDTTAPTVILSTTEEWVSGDIGWTVSVTASDDASGVKTIRAAFIFTE